MERRPDAIARRPARNTALLILSGLDSWKWIEDATVSSERPQPGNFKHAVAGQQKPVRDPRSRFKNGQVRKIAPFLKDCGITEL